MGRIKCLDRYQKGVLIIMTAMVLIFAVIYSVTIKREGFAYRNEILIPSQENGNTIYSGKVEGEQVRIIVDADKTVEFKYEDKTYGPYTAKEDPTAIPKDNEMGEDITGVELYDGEEIIFRGGVWKQGDIRLLINEDGSLENTVRLSATTMDGTVLDENGNVIDPMEPSVWDVLDVMNDPELTHKGEWYVWFIGLFACIITAISILFVDELFHLNLFFQIRNADRAEPSDWMVAARYISWTVMPIMAMMIFILGLR